MDSTALEDVNEKSSPPEELVIALDSLKGLTFRPEVHVSQIPAPTRIAPYSVALQAEVNPSKDLDPDQLRGHAKFVMLYDPEGQPAWNGRFRIVVHAQAPFDSETGDDPMLGEVIWSYLTGALDAAGASFHSLNGTVTRAFNETFGGLYLDSSRLDAELRASWTPETKYLTEHLLAWADFAAQIAGLPPEGTNISSLPFKVDKI